MDIKLLMQTLTWTVDSSVVSPSTMWTIQEMDQTITTYFWY